MNKVSVLIVIFLSLSLDLQAEKILIGVEEIDYLPYYRSYDTNDTKKAYEGFAADLLSAFASEQKLEIEFRPLPIKRLYGEMLNGKIHFKFPDHPYWGKDFKDGKKVYYSKAVVGFVDGVLVPREKENIPASQLNSLGYVRGFSPWPYLEEMEKGKLKGREINSLESLLKLTLDTRVDGAYFNVLVAQHRQKNTMANTNTLVLAKNLPHDINNYRLSTSKESRLMKEFDIFLESTAAAAIYKKYQLRVHNN